LAQDFAAAGGASGSSDHGTNIAAIIVGVAPETKILALNVFRADGYAYETDVIAALDWVIANRTPYNIAAVNLSLGTGDYTAACANLAVAKIIDDLKSAGIATVVSSSNSGYKDALAYPACSPSAISVGAVYDANATSSMYWQEAGCTDSSPLIDHVPCFSDSAPFLTLLAPGAPTVNAGNISLAGTSQASAHVAGAAALLMGMDPHLTVDAVISRLTTTGVPVMDAKSGIATPRLDVAAAVHAMAGAVAVAQGSGQGSQASSTAKVNATGNGAGAQSGSKAGALSPGANGASGKSGGQNGSGGVAGPGWLTADAPAVSHDEAMRYFGTVKANNGSGAVRFTAMSATDATPEITELARSLMNDPKLIYDYVHNNIDYVPYYGSLKGATLTYLDGSGNDFDQASLMIALLNVSGISAQYVYGQMTIPGAQLANWGGVDQNPNAIGALWPSGGVPMTTLYTDGSATIDRVWVQATINGTNYLFDPAFKTYTATPKINLATAMGYSQSDFLSAADSGATIGTNYVQNLNEGNIRSKLATYANNLVSTIRGQYPNGNVEDIVGGRSIVQSTTTQLPTTVPFSPATEYSWSAIPSTYFTTLTVNIPDGGLNITINTHDLAGKRLTLTYNSSYPVLTLDGTVLASGTTALSSGAHNCTIAINHPYAANSGTYQDQSVTYTPITGSNYAIVYNLGGGVSDTLLQKLQQQLATFKAQGLADTSEPVLVETLHLMGMTWLKEVTQTMKLLSVITDIVPIIHHNVGFMAQETGYYIDVKVGSSSIISKHATTSDQTATFKAFPLFGSAFEHGILEQLMGSGNPGISTMKLFQIANAAGGKIYSVNSANISTVQQTLQALPANEQYSTTPITGDWLISDN
jgi:hypothetical protein